MTISGVYTDMKNIRFAFVVSCLGLFSGCAFFSSSIEIEVALPELPEPWKEAFPEILFSIEFPGIDGTIEHISVEPGARSKTISIEKKINTPIVAVPSSGGKSLYPCGGIFMGTSVSTDFGSCKLSLTWEDGFAASILLSLLKEGYNIQIINTERLLSEIEGRSGGDPWSLDKKKIAEELASGEFTIYDIDSLPSVSIRLSPLTGTWISENPFSPPLSADQDNVLSIEKIAYGFHRYFNAETSRQIDIMASENEVRWIEY
jgi:hypothetical protein